MNAIVAQARTAWEVVQGEPALLVFAGLILLAVLLVVLLVALPSKRPAAVDDLSRPRLVIDLTRRGKSAGEIARRTGLARDAITLAVAVTARGARQSRPAPARTAERRAPGKRDRDRVFASYPMSVQRVR